MAKRCGSSAGPKACSFIKNLGLRRWMGWSFFDPQEWSMKKIQNIWFPQKGTSFFPPTRHLGLRASAPRCAVHLLARVETSGSHALSAQPLEDHGFFMVFPAVTYKNLRTSPNHLTGFGKFLDLIFPTNHNESSINRTPAACPKQPPPPPWHQPSCQSMVVQFTSAGKRRARLQRPSPTGEKHNDMCRFFRTREM